MGKTPRGEIGDDEDPQDQKGSATDAQDDEE
jgi:hypothetical protein